jgi:hypothetical protein
MTDADFLRGSFTSLEVNAEFSEAILGMHDGSRLCFRHRVAERRVAATGAGASAGGDTLAGQVLEKIALFRLNRKHLDVQFGDGSGWEARFGDPGAGSRE